MPISSDHNEDVEKCLDSISKHPSEAFKACDKLAVEKWHIRGKQTKKDKCCGECRVARRPGSAGIVPGLTNCPGQCPG